MDDKGPGSSRGGALEREAQEADDLRSDPGASFSERPSAMPPPSIPPGCSDPRNDEMVRTRLIADIMRVLHEPSIPESTRLAGITLIGWLARRRPHEMPHAIGIEEARESERRIRRAKAR